MKNTNKFIKAYEEIANQSFINYGYFYPPRTLEELISWNKDLYEKYLHKLETNDVTKTEKYLKLLDAANEFGFYVALQQLDFELLNNVLYQNVRQRLLISGITASGTDHCIIFFDCIAAFSCNDFNVLSNFLPKDLAHSNGNFYTDISTNLLKVLYFKESNLKDEALKKADKFLLKKSSLWEQYVILYLKALIHKDAKGASKCLYELCCAYQKIKRYGQFDKSLAKCFAPEIHGLYRFARIVEENLFEQVTQPKHFCFSSEFEEWQKENNYPKGTLFYHYPKEMDYMNKILEAELPIVTLYKPNSNKKVMYKDVDKFVLDLTKKITRN